MNSVPITLDDLLTMPTRLIFAAEVYARAAHRQARTRAYDAASAAALRQAGIRG